MTVAPKTTLARIRAKASAQTTVKTFHLLAILRLLLVSLVGPIWAPTSWGKVPNDSQPVRWLVAAGLFHGAPPYTDRRDAKGGRAAPRRPFVKDAGLDGAGVRVANSPRRGPPLVVPSPSPRLGASDRAPRAAHACARSGRRLRQRAQHGGFGPPRDGHRH